MLLYVFHIDYTYKMNWSTLKSQKLWKYTKMMQNLSQFLYHKPVILETVCIFHVKEKHQVYELFHTYYTLVRSTIIQWFISFGKDISKNWCDVQKRLKMLKFCVIFNHRPLCRSSDIPNYSPWPCMIENDTAVCCLTYLGVNGMVVFRNKLVKDKPKMPILPSTFQIPNLVPQYCVTTSSMIICSHI